MLQTHISGRTRMVVSMLAYAPGTFILVGTVVLVVLLVAYALVYIFFIKKE
jgi:hypothetical protein